MWINQKFFKISVAIILVLAIVFLALQIWPIIDWFLQFIGTIVLPILMAGVLYYVLRPLKHWMTRHKIPDLVAIGILFLFLIIILSLFVTFLWPLVSDQIDKMASFPTERIKEVEKKTVDFLNVFNFFSVSQDRLRELLTYYFQQILTYISANIIQTLGSIAKVASYFILTPFLLFYFLKDDHLLFAKAIQVAPAQYKDRALILLNDIDATLSSYINGQVVVAMIVGLMILIGYTTIGLPYAFLLALIAFLFNLIPFFGPFISSIPAVLIGLTIGPFMALKVISVVLLAHLLDLNLVSPRIVGPRLQVHPVTILLLLVASFPMMGFLGLFLIIPAYAVLKVIIKNILAFRQ